MSCFVPLISLFAIKKRKQVSPSGEAIALDYTMSISHRFSYLCNVTTSNHLGRGNIISFLLAIKPELKESNLWKASLNKWFLSLFGIVVIPIHINKATAFFLHLADICLFLAAQRTRQTERWFPFIITFYKFCVTWYSYEWIYWISI